MQPSCIAPSRFEEVVPSWQTPLALGLGGAFSAAWMAPGAGYRTGTARLEQDIADLRWGAGAFGFFRGVRNTVHEYEGSGGGECWFCFIVRRSPALFPSCLWGAVCRWPRQTEWFGCSSPPPREYASGSAQKRGLQNRSLKFLGAGSCKIGP